MERLSKDALEQNCAVQTERGALGSRPSIQASHLEDRDFCDRWRIREWPLVWTASALVEHRHAQSLCGFIRLHWRYGQGAFLYQAKRKERASGTMAEDLGFHRSLPKAVWVALSDHSLGHRLQLLSALMLWQLANALGFFWAAGRHLFSRR